MKYIGAHVSVETGVQAAPHNAAAIGAKAFALFTRNPARWKSPDLQPAEIEAFKQGCLELGFTPAQILPHDSYLINLGSPDKQKAHLSRLAFLDELHRCEQLGLTLLNFHPGAHLNQMEPDACLDQIADNLNRCLAETQGVKAVIENTAGQGSNLGFTFEQIARIIDRVEDKGRVGVCIDTCHAFSAGYDLSSEEGYRKTWDDFDRIIGPQYLRGMHINDSKKALSSRVDRHESLRHGTIGPRFFELLMADPRTDGIPLILETPDETLYPEEIAWLYSLVPKESD